MGLNRGVGLLAGLLLVVSLSVAQSPNGTISGIVLDPSGGLIVGADVLIINNATGVGYPGKANSEGYYVVPNLPPGNYRIQVSNSGFKTIIKPDIVIHVEDALAINFTLPIGAASEIVTVEGGAPLINTTDASVGTVVDRKFVENIPLNGRSFQDLILLAPGVVTNTPQVSGSIGINGEFSVNGQRTESNYYTVDGVSANVGISGGNPYGPSNSGSLPAATILGTTQALVPVDALEEFRVQTSSYSAEFGRNPGGQFSFVTRSGTNQWHGTGFDYLRNGAFDANDWFNDYLGVRQAPLRQNDFGGTLGGPIVIPRVYDGRNKTFFFFSYEGLRLTQPEEASVSYVPTLAVRTTAPSALQPVLNAYPLPFCPSSAVNCSTDLGTGLGEFIGAWSSPSSINSYGIRLDHSINQRAKLFFRFSHTPSSGTTRSSSSAFTAPSFPNKTTADISTYTLGVGSVFSNRISNDLRLNFTSVESHTLTYIDSFGGATPTDLIELQGISTTQYPAATIFGCLEISSLETCFHQGESFGKQNQWNLVDVASISLGKHQLKVGFDYRRLMANQYPSNPYVAYLYFSENSVLTNAPDLGFALTNLTGNPVYTNFSSFAQDEWKVTPRLNLSLGLRWEVNPAPSAPKGNLPYTIQGNLNELGALTLAPEGTPLWQTSWHNVAPRLGAAYVLRNAPGVETVLRGGLGIFYDTGQQDGSQGYQGPGFSSGPQFFGTFAGVPSSFPIPPSQATPVAPNPPVPPYPSVYAFPPNLQLPFTLQWNASIAQSVGKSQALTISYVGANGRRLLKETEMSLASNPDLPSLILFENGLTSSYNAMQAQYQRKLSEGLQVLASYTWAHSIDFGSYNSSLPYERASSDFDVRQSFSAALSYEIPNASSNKLVAIVLSHWAIDDRFTARTAFPVTLDGNLVVDPATGQTYNSGLNRVAGEPLYLYGSQCGASDNGTGCPGGRAINPAAFSVPGANEFGDAPRNLTRGFGAWQMDLAMRREFPIYENLKLQFRAEAFNIFNHPNFGLINPNYCSPGPGCTFGQATASLAQSLGVLNPLYQMGGPRSMQFALKLIF